MRRPPSRLRWFALEALDREESWRVFLVEEIEGDHDGELRGLCIYGRREIQILAAQPNGRLLRTVMHELSHASNEEDNGEVEALAEEKFVTAAEAQLWDFMVQMGVRVPDLPSGFDGLRERSAALTAKKMLAKRAAKKAETK